MAKLLFLFAPGAGAGSSHPWMKRWKKLLGELGSVKTLDYPYMLEGRSRPDVLPKLIAAHRAAWAKARKTHRGPVVLIGKSMGSRIGCHLALEEKVFAVICLGYPLCGAGDRTKLRDQVLYELRTPVLFVQGTRDSLCPLDLLSKVRAQMRCLNRLKIVVDGDHSLTVAKRQLRTNKDTQDQVEKRLLGVIQKFLELGAKDKLKRKNIPTRNPSSGQHSKR
jgi:predicted alpha/beta-hydrolase family hydrolase